MQLLGFEISRARTKAAVSALTTSGFFGTIRESFAGAWQKNVEIDAPRSLLANGGVFACVSRITNDIAKLPFEIRRVDSNGIWTVAPESPYSQVLRKPNSYQTRIHFVRSWVASLLLAGNAYLLKERDGRGIPIRLHVLDPKLVLPVVTDDGAVYYQINRDLLANIPSGFTVPASEIIHDRMMTLWHPLIGVSPLLAAGLSATQANRIQNNSARFFQNMSRPSGILTAPGRIDDEVAARLKVEFEQGFSAGNIGRLFVGGSGLKYEAMTIPAQESQLIEQLKWTVEDVARAFSVPLHMIGAGNMPAVANVGAMKESYYTQTLQSIIESMELSLDDGLELPTGLRSEFDIDAMMRMDPLARAELNDKMVHAGVYSPDEARKKENMPPVPGGGSPYLQQQNYSLAALAKRDAGPDPFATAKPAAPESPKPVDPPKLEDPSKAIEVEFREFLTLIKDGVNLIEFAEGGDEQRD